MANNADSRTAKLLLTAAAKLRSQPILKGRFVFDDGGATQDSELETLMPVIASIIEGVAALPFRYQLLVRLMGGAEPMPAELGMNMWAHLYHQDMLGQAPLAIQQWLTKLSENEGL